ncbi:MAG: hypothetical protein WCI03_02475 [bacterium]
MNEDNHKLVRGVGAHLPATIPDKLPDPLQNALGIPGCDTAASNAV